MDRYEEIYASTPPAPPPKPGSHEVSRIGTPTTATTTAATSVPSPLHAAAAAAAAPPTLSSPSVDPSQQQQFQPPPPPNPNQSQQQQQQHSDLPEAAGGQATPLAAAAQQAQVARPQAVPDPGEQWLPSFLEDKSKQDLAEILSTPSLLAALTHAPSTAPPSLTTSTAALATTLAENIDLAAHLVALERRLADARARTQALLLSAHALERQWRAKEAAQDVDHALRRFAPASLYQQLSAGVVEQGQVCVALEESFLDGDGAGAGGDEREVLDWVRRYREAKKGYYLRRERKERWDEGRVGGWR